MSSVVRMVCLAVSRKHGGYCVAGIDRDTGRWVRPVSDLDDGRLERGAILIDGNLPRLGDILSVPLADTGPDFGFAGENRRVLDGAWQCTGHLSVAQLHQLCQDDGFILHNPDNAVSEQYLAALPLQERHTLQLVEAYDFDVHSPGPSSQGGRRWVGTFVSAVGERLSAPITDPELIGKLERGYVPDAHCLVTVSLSMPYAREDWQGEGTPCWKLIAGVMEFGEGTYRKVARMPTATEIAARTRDAIGTGDDVIRRSLKDVFGFDSFRPNQEEVVRAVIDGRDCFVVMPTGGGKSLCFQLPAYVLAGTCMVISPLIALMKDQVDAARVNGLNAACLNSTLSDAERTAVFRQLMDGMLDLIYVSPERFAMPLFVENVRRVPLSLIAVDEAHCVSEWGHDFRPDYLSLGGLVDAFPNVPVAAFTATATRRVHQDIVERLRLRSPLEIRASFNRPNLYYQVAPKWDVAGQVAAFVRERPGQAGIVYRTTRRDVDSLADHLQCLGINAAPYHAGMDDRDRAANQEAFNRDEVDVVVATIAFGMGVDKPNVRFVLHADLPKNMESYYQETGRSGRDGEPAHCLLLFGRGDIPRIRYFIDQVEDDTERDRQRASLNEVVSYASDTTTCRRRRILRYFGEELPAEACTGCDCCGDDRELVDISDDARIVIEAVMAVGERFGITHVIDIICGARTKRVQSLGHARLSVYGAGRGRPKAEWRQVVDDLLSQRVLKQSIGQYPVLTLTGLAEDVLNGSHQVEVRQTMVTAPPPMPKMDTPAAEPVVDPDLFDRLRDLRRRFARSRHVPPYVIFSDRTLRDMVARRPTSLGDMRMVHGVGDVKLEMYGKAFLEEIVG